MLALMRIPTTALAALMAVVLFLPSSSSIATAAEPIDCDELFKPDHVIDVQIDLADEDWDTLRQQSRDVRAMFSGGDTSTSPFTYFKGSVTIDGKKVDSVGIRKKGFIGSLDNERPSLKISFTKYVDQHPYSGINVLTLNNNKQDTALVSQYLTYKLFRDAGVHAPRVSFARVTVGKRFLGVYSHVESVKKPFLRNSFGENAATGNLYEGTLADFYPKAVEKIEAKTNKIDHNRSRILAFSELLAAEGELDMAEVEKFVDIDNFFRFWVTEGVIRYWDGYSANQNNFYFYVNPANNLGYFMPWGADGSFSKDGGPFNRGGWGRGSSGPTSIYAQAMLSNRLYNTKGMPERYRKEMKKLLDDVWKEDALIAEIDRVEKLVEPHLHDRQKRSGRAMDGTRDFIRSRREVVLKELEDWPAELPLQPRKPMYHVALGDMKGDFKTTWHEKAPDDTESVGSVNAKLNFEGEEVEFKQIGASVQEFEIPRWGRRGGGPQGPGPANIVLTGVRKSDGEKVTLSFVVDRAAFESQTKEPIKITGRYTEGEAQRGFGGWGRGGPNRILNGTVLLAKAGTKSGDAIEGSLDLKISEMRGGMFDRRNERSREERRREPPLRERTGLEKALDTNADGSLTAEEIKKAPAALKRLDKNKDGKLTADELLTAP